MELKNKFGLTIPTVEKQIVAHKILHNLNHVKGYCWQSDCADFIVQEIKQQLTFLDSQSAFLDEEDKEVLDNIKLQLNSIF